MTGAATPTQQPPKKSNLPKYLGIGCLSIVMLMVIVVIFAGIYIYNNAGRLATAGLANLGAYGLTQLVEESKIPADQKVRINQRIAELRDGVKDGSVTMDHLEDLTARLADRQLIQIAMVDFVSTDYLARSGLDQQQKQQARRTMDRFARGLYEGSIDPGAVGEVMEPIQQQRPDGSTELKPNPTDAELQEAIDLAKAKADEANVPDEPFEINYADEFDQAVDATLAGEPLPATPINSPDGGPAIDPQESFITPESEMPAE